MFSVTVLHDDRIVLVAEQRPDASEEDSFQWMSRVLQVRAHSLSYLCSPIFWHPRNSPGSLRTTAVTDVALKVPAMSRPAWFSSDSWYHQTWDCLA